MESKNTLFRLNFASSAMIVVLALVGCGGNGGNGSGTAGATTGSVGPGTIQKLSIPSPVQVTDNGASIGNSGGTRYYGGSGFYQAPSGSVTNLKGLDGTASNSHANGLNEDGIIVGTSQQNGHYRAVAWINGTIEALPTSTNGSTYTDSFAAAIDNLGHIVGWGQSLSGGVTTYEALYWPSPSDNPLEIGEYALCSIGGNGMAGAFTPSPNNPGQSDLTLVNVTEGTQAALASAVYPNVFVNSSGAAAYSSGANQAYFANPSGGKSLIYADALPTSINSAGDVTLILKGDQAYGARSAFIYNSQMKLVNLNQYLPKNSGWYLRQANWINNSGMVVGTGTYNGKDNTPFVLQLPKGAF